MIELTNDEIKLLDDAMEFKINQHLYKVVETIIMARLTGATKS